MQRRKISKSGSRRLFNKTAGNRRIHVKNILPRPMRGGIRL